MKKFLACLLIAGSTQALADWKLDNSQSSLNFVSTKNQHISETHKFAKLSGTLSDAGKLDVAVDLSSVNSGIEIRDKRMQEMLFEVSTRPTASLTASIKPELLKKAMGKSSRHTIDAAFTINGQTRTLPVKVQITKLSGNAILATTPAPILLNAADFKLDAGVAALQKIAGLAGISLSVPVTFSVTFVES